MREIYSEYIASKSPNWSAASRRSESVRLNRIIKQIDGDAPKLWAVLQEYGPYTRQTIWTRVEAFWDWGIQNRDLTTPNPYKAFHEANPRMFRGAYKRRPCQQTFDEIMAKLRTIADPEIRNTCEVLLIGGLRWCELFAIDGDHVIGKGGKRRKVYLPDPLGPIVERKRYSAVYRQLKQFGLTPHKLRHARMTNMAENGATLWELRKFAGWSNISVAESYITARDERIAEIAAKRTEAKVSGVMGVLKLMAQKTLERVR